MAYTAKNSRYDKMIYNRVGKSGLKLPALSLGIWHNFGSSSNFETAQEIVKTAFDFGITHIDAANNYGPPAGSAEQALGKILSNDLKPYRDELIISSKAGYFMWDGPYGDFGSKKYLAASLDQSLKRLKLDYVDIFYHHRPDPDTPLEETAGALDLFVRQGKSLYIGISNYNAQQTEAITAIFRQLNTPFIIHQPRYNMLSRQIEDGLTEVLDKNGIGCIAYSPLAQGVLTDRYLKDIPADSRAAVEFFLKSADVKARLPLVYKLKQIADARGQTIAQLALSWVLSNKTVTSALIGVSSVAQLKSNLQALDNLEFDSEERKKIDQILAE